MVTNNEFYEAIADDVKREFIQLLSVAGHGKTSSLRTILQYCKDKHPDLTFKIFDCSLAWYHNAPVKYRQLVNERTLRSGQVQNVCDCVYEIGQLTEEQKRLFVATILQQDWQYRYNLKLENPGALEREPFIIYIWEEANIYFGSYSFRSNNPSTEVFKNVASVGRNFRMRGVLIATAEVGEISPSLRRRSKKIYGKVESESDLAKIRRRDKSRRYKVESQVMKMPKYHFLYDRGKDAYGPVRIPDAVDHTPEDYTPVELSEPDMVKNGEVNQKRFNWWVTFLGSAFITFMFLLYFFG